MDEIVFKLLICVASLSLVFIHKKFEKLLEEYDRRLNNILFMIEMSLEERGDTGGT